MPLYSVDGYGGVEPNRILAKTFFSIRFRMNSMLVLLYSVDGYDGVEPNRLQSYLVHDDILTWIWLWVSVGTSV